MARPDLDPVVVEALARTYQQQVIDTYKLYGQRNGIDQPEELHRLPFEGLGQWIGARLEQLVVVLVIILVAGLSMTGGSIP